MVSNMIIIKEGVISPRVGSRALKNLPTSAAPTSTPRTLATTTAVTYVSEDTEDSRIVQVFFCRRYISPETSGEAG